MGGAVSAGEDNDELIDNLVEAEYIKSPHVERIFRAVDRGDYYLEGCKENAYRDLAWKHGNIHLSAPCIYSEVMESLKLGPGMSFLNLGSGTGYLSTMAGLVLGTYGVNHGVELHDEVVEYARAKLEEFQSTSPALDKYEFCPPNFVVGNCLLLDSTCHQYDRVYCGASCPTEHENYMKNLVRVGGILVMPLNDHLLQVTRTGETTYEVKNVLPVSFASLITPNPSEVHNLIKLPEKNPLKLKEICRSVIRTLLRASAEAENPSLRDQKKLVPSKRRKNKRRVRKVVIPVFHNQSESGDNRNTSSNEQADDEMDPRSKYTENEQMQERVTEELICCEHTIRLSECGCDSDKAINGNKDAGARIETSNPDNGRRASSLDDANEMPCSSQFKCRSSSAEDTVCRGLPEEVVFNVVRKIKLVQTPLPEDVLGDLERAMYRRVEAMDTSDVPSKVSAIDPISKDLNSNGRCDQIPETEIVDRDISETNILTDDAAVDTPASNTTPTDFSVATESVTDISCANPTVAGESKVSESEKKNNFGVHHLINGIGNGDSGIDNISDDSVPEESSSDPEKTEGENGLADISASHRDSSDDNWSHRSRMRLYKRSAEEIHEEEPHFPRISGESHITAKCCRKSVVFKRIAYSDVDSDDLDDFESDSGKESYPKDYEGTRAKSDLSCYTHHMKQKINMLPLPQYLKMYLNFSRPV